MRGYFFVAVLVAGLVAAGSAWAEDDVDFDKEMQNIELQKKQMDLQQRHVEMDFQQEMRKLELEQKRNELDRQRKMMGIMPPCGSHIGPRMQGGMPPGPGCQGMCGPRASGEIPPMEPCCPSMKGQGESRGGCSGCPKIKDPDARGKGSDIRRDGDKFHHGPPRCCRAGMVLMLLGMCVIHVLLAVWVSRDIRQRNSGSGVWVAIALLAGLMGALVYAVVRIGDNKAA